MVDGDFTFLCREYANNPSPMLMRKVLRLWRSHIFREDVPSMKVAVLSSFTVSPWLDYLEVQGALDGIRVEAQNCNYGQFRQDVYSQDSWLTEMNPDVIIVAIDADALFGQPICHPSTKIASQATESFDKGVEELLNMSRSLTKIFPQTLILINNWIVPTTSSFGILENKIGSGLPSSYRRANGRLAESLWNITNVFVVDVDNLAASVGKREFIDVRMKFLADMRIDERYLPHLAGLYGRYFRALRGKIRKCLVLDLDNTLWGGVVGEDGFDGIEIDPVKAPGSAYYAFQRRILDLYHRGIILAINSKNNWDEAMNVLSNHPYMVLRPQHFAAMAINWNDKPENMKSLSQELNIGLDSMVFLDDDPHQCGLMEAMLPEVMTHLLPQDPSCFERFLSSLEVFDTLTYSEEDSRRGEMYAQERLRRDELKNETSSGKSLEQYYQELQMECVIGEPDDFTIPRIAQLTQRTNQFNLTTRRYSDGEIRNFATSKQAYLRWISLKDKFGDLGLVGVIIILEKSVGSWEIDTLLMSCRALGRQVETAFLHKVLSGLFENGAREVVGVYISSPKNNQVASFYANVGFDQVLGGRYLLTSVNQLPLPPKWIAIYSPESNQKS